MRMIPQLEMSSTYAEYVSGSDSDLNDNPLQNDELDKMRQRMILFLDTPPKCRVPLILSISSSISITPHKP